MRKLITLVLLSTLCSLTVKAQTAADDYVLPKKKEAALDKVSATVSAGTMLGFTNCPQMRASGSFVSSQVGYNLSSKWKLNVGLMHYTASRNPSFMNSNDNRQNQGALPGNYNAASLRLEYKISDRAYIGISTGIGNGEFNYMNDPFRTRCFNSFENPIIMSNPLLGL